MLLADVGAALDDPDADPNALVLIRSWLSLASRQRLDNASYAMTVQEQNREWSQRAIIERALEAALDEIEAQHNNHQPFPDPPPGSGTRAYSQRRREAGQKKAASST